MGWDGVHLGLSSCSIYANAFNRVDGECAHVRGYFVRNGGVYTSISSSPLDAGTRKLVDLHFRDWLLVVVSYRLRWFLGN